MQKKNTVFWWPALIAVFVLLVPLLANVLSDEVAWSFMDFLIAGVMVYIFTTVEIILWKKLRSVQRWLIVFFTALLFAILWVEMAVGLFDSPLAGLQSIVE
ncbi:MAG: hypothetical protein CMP53_03800 [Flavobacteriales bacterium]|nr:hypothetical protein [Flavobacteriales bacterium]